MQASNIKSMSYTSGSSLSARSAFLLPEPARQLGGTVLYHPFWQCRLLSPRTMFYAAREGRARIRASWWCKCRIIVIMLIIVSIFSNHIKYLHNMLNRYHILCRVGLFLTRNRARPPPTPAHTPPVHEQVNTQ